MYFKAMFKYHARKKETLLGTLLVTNLSGFPSTLTVIPVPGGDVRQHRESFIVNENLKRLGCSGRAGLSLSPATGATRAKFHQLYQTSELVPLEEAAIELIKLCQAALVIFNKIEPEYADGLLCNVTEQAITNWWTDLGTDYFNAEPGDGILGPTTVSGLLGMLLGARNRLNACGSPVSKDVFNLKATKRGIAYFQKWQKLPRTRRLDSQTLERLHRVTSKAANSEGWAVPKAVRSTVAEFGGKGGEMVMGMVGGRDKGGISEVETIEIHRFIAALSGERCKWLWYGKPRKNLGNDFFGNLVSEDDLVFSGDETPGYSRVSGRKESAADLNQPSPAPNHIDHLYANPSGSQSSLEPSDRDQALRRVVLRSVTGRMHEARSGLGRFKDAVGISGLRGHYHKISRDDNTSHTNDRLGGAMSIARHEPASPVGSTQRNSTGSDPGLPSNSARHLNNTEHPDISSSQLASAGNTSKRIEDDAALTPVTFEPEDSGIPVTSIHEPTSSVVGTRRDPFAEEAASLNVDETDVSPSPVDLNEFRIWSTSSLDKLSHETPQKAIHRARRRSISFDAVDDLLSLNQAEFMINRLTRNEMSAPDILAEECFATLQAKRATGHVIEYAGLAQGSTKKSIKEIRDLEIQCMRNGDELNKVHHQKHEEFNTLQYATTNLLAEGQTSLDGAVKKIEVLGAKLEYELDALLSKIEDVEDSVAEFGRQVVDIEERAGALKEGEVRKTAWYWKALVFMTGLK